MSESKKCMGRVPLPGVWHRDARCSRNAVTEAGYCKQHDPTERQKRRSARPLSKLTIQSAIRKATEAWIRLHIPAEADQLMTAIHLGWDSFANVSPATKVFGEQIPLPEEARE